MTYCYYQGKPTVVPLHALLPVLLYLTGLLTRSTYILTRPPSETAVRYAVLGAKRWRRYDFPS